jgi:hypothetical protein
MLRRIPIMRVAVFGATVPPTNCELDMAPNGVIDVGDFGVLVSIFGRAPGPSCGNSPGTPCPFFGAPCSGLSETIEVVGPISR